MKTLYCDVSQGSTQPVGEPGEGVLLGGDLQGHASAVRETAPGEARQGEAPRPKYSLLQVLHARITESECIGRHLQTSQIP